MAEEWAALLKREEATTREFLDALDVIARHCKFFPTPADLYEALREVREHPPRIPERFRLTEPPHTGRSEAQKARVRQCREIIAAQLTRRITPVEASRRLNALGLR